MWAPWIRSAVRPAPRRNPKTRLNFPAARRPALVTLEDRTVPAAIRIGSTAFDVANAVATDAAGNVYVAGDFRGTVDFDPGAGTVNLTNADATADAFLAKYSAAGALLWAGQLANGTVTGLAVDAAGAVYATGRFSGTRDFDLGAGTSNLTSAQFGSAFVAKYNPDRTLGWARVLGGGTGASTGGDAIALDAAGNVYTSGVLSNGTADFDPGPGTSTLTNTSGNANSYVSKLDAGGNFVWARQFANDPTIAAGVWTAGLDVDAGQNVYLTGVFVGRADFDPGPGTQWVTTFDTTSPSGDGYAVKLTAAGDLAWVVRMGSAAGREDGSGIAVDAAGNAFVTGWFHNTTTIDATAGDTTLTSAGSDDVFVLRLNTAGGLDWARRVGAAGPTGGQAIAYDGADNLYVSGYYSNTVDFDPGAGTFNLTAAGGFTDVFALRLKTDGSFVNAWGLGGGDYEFGNDVAVTPAGTVVVAGRFRGTADFDPGPGTLNLTSAGEDDAFVALLPQDGGGNQPPAASNGTLTTTEDTAATGTLSATDPDGNPLTFTLVSTADAHGTVTITNAATGAYTYTPAANYNGPASFTFKASDGSLDSNTATVSITVTAVNDPPVANAASFTVAEDTLLSGRVTATDADGDTLTFSVAPANRPAHADAFGMQADGSFRYLPKFNYNGPDQFTFTVTDGKGGTATATVTITVTPVNDAPFVDSPTVTTNEDTAFSGSIQYLEAEGEAVTFTRLTGPANGTVTLNADGSYVYTPTANFYGTDSFTFRAGDPHGATRDGTVTVKVTAVNDAPVARDDAYALDEDGSLTLSVGRTSAFHLESEPGAWVGDGRTWDYTGANATFDVRKRGDNGAQVLVNGSEFWVMLFEAAGTNPFTPGYYPDARRFATATNPGLDVGGNGRGENQLVGEFVVYDVTYGPNDTITSYAAGFVQQGQNFDGTLDPPVRGRIQVNTTVGAGGGVLANDADVDADLYTARLVSGPANGTLTLNPDGTLTYTPNPNFSGTDSFTYRTSDGRADSNVATVTLTVRAANDAPAAADGRGATDEDAALNGSLTATDVDGDALTFQRVAGPANGAVTVNANGSFTYTPNPNFHGTDSFTFKATDGTADSNTATFTVTVRGVNDAPVSANGSGATDEDAALTGTLTASDVEADALTYSLVAGPSHGAVTVNANGTFTYTPAGNYNGSDSFTFRASDGTASSNTATFAITVRPVNDAPAAADDTAATDEDAAVTIGVRANDTDADGDALTVSAVTQPTNGSAVINADGTVTYTPAANYNGADSFTYTVSDGNGGTDTATVSLTVRPVNDAPAAADDAAGTDEDTAVTIGVLGNDTDADGDTLRPVVVANPAHGTVVVNADGTITYTPAANYNGPDTFTYKANDGGLDSAVAKVTVAVRAVNDAPAAVNDTYATTVGTALTVPAAGVLANDTDADGDPLTAAPVSGPANGTLTLNPDGSFTYTPNADFTGTDTFTYTANDGSLDSGAATVAIRVAAAADTEGKVTGSGQLNGGKKRFTVNVQSRPRRPSGFTFTGSLTFVDTQANIRLRSTAIKSFRVEDGGTRAVITGTARVNGRAGYTFTIVVQDLGEPGVGRDTFRIQITGPTGAPAYDSLEGVLTRGNIQVHKKA